MDIAGTCLMQLVAIDVRMCKDPAMTGHLPCRAFSQPDGGYAPTPQHNQTYPGQQHYGEVRLWLLSVCDVLLVAG